MLARHVTAGGAAAFALSVALVAAPVAAQDLGGTYAVRGTNPGGQGEYRGEVAIVPAGEAWQVAWTIGGARHVGTAILTGDTLSVVYQPEGELPGIAVYELQPDGSLEGTWTGLGGNALGTEEWVPRGRS
ncbi:hypothetical protein [Salinarimonas ramus]|uniref:Uncharacterized protein n=1 Tax=Salinarimonas ramus TaxID=690164 RepID=A0A917V7S1_9HYPH|nr:hypothetical protein [Salinarimonas ramus]GGK47196.1 hypothetical protein GCM10011322_37780 [Salinarimonas ramus]